MKGNSPLRDRRSHGPRRGRSWSGHRWGSIGRSSGGARWHWICGCRPAAFCAA